MRTTTKLVFMAPPSDAIRTYFAKLGLAVEIADIYLALHAHGPQTISELARAAHVERTRIYRLIDALMNSNLVEVESQYKRGVIKAAPISNLRILINQKEEELRNLQDELGLIEQVLARNSLSSPSTRVQFYKGAEGVRQMLWNQLRSKGELVGYSYRILDEATGRKFMEKYAAAFEERKLSVRLLVGDDFVQSWRENRPKVQVRRRIQGMTYHSVDPKLFTIAHSCMIYDDVTAYYHWREGEVFGIEIYNQAIADSQRQLFELIWEKSQPETRF
jgi:sugar-specific transcriptional regulator TrmB